MDLRHLRYFLAIVESGGFRSAARALHVSQPPLSRAVRDLERELGCELIDRSMGRVVATAAGTILATRSRRILRAIDDAASAVRDAARAHGAARVGHVLPEYFEDPTLARALARLRKSAHLHVEVAPMLPRKAGVALAEERIDVAFVFLPFESGDVEARIEPILHDRLVAAVPDGDPLARSSRVTLAKLAKRTLVMFPRRSMPERYDDIVGHFTRAKLTPKVVTVGPSLRQALERVADGHGVAMVPDRASRAHADLGLVLRPIADVASLWTLAAVIRQDARRSAVQLVRGLQRVAARV